MRDDVADQTAAEAEAAVGRFDTRIERTYHRRRQGALGRVTPVEYETINTREVAFAA